VVFLDIVDIVLDEKGVAGFYFIYNSNREKMKFEKEFF